MAEPISMLPELFYTIIFSVSILASVVTVILGLLIVITVIVHRPSRTVKNLLFCYIIVSTCIFACFQTVAAVFGLNSDAIHPPPACIFQGYVYHVTCALVCVSYLVQSISIVSFVVLYKHKYVLGWRAHWMMIGVSCIWALLQPLFTIRFDHTYEFEPKARLCRITTRVLHSILLALSITYLIPCIMITIIYGIVLHKVQQSTRRIAAFGIGRSISQTNNCTPNIQREWKLMKNILLLVSIILFAGIPFSILVIWHATTSVSPPEPLYLLSSTNVTLCFVLKMLVLFHLNQEVKVVLIRFLRQLLLR